MRSFATLACLMLFACGKVETPPPPDGPPDGPMENTDGLKSGTRLKLRWNVFDGTKSFASVYDSMRQETCFPRKFTDGKMYCTPTPSANVVYEDAACTVPLGRQLVSCPSTPINYYFETDPVTCDNLAVKVYPKAAQISANSYYTLSSAGCTMSTNTGYELFRLGPAIPLTEFAAIEAPTTAEGKVQQRFYESSDGARMFAGFYDNDLGSDCFFVQDAAKSSAKCVPSSVGANTYYGDAACTLPRTQFRRGCVVPKYTTRITRSCSYVSTIPEIYLTGPLTGGTLYTNFGTCTATTPAADQSYYSVGTALVEPGQLTRAPSAEGTGRYRPIRYASGGNLIRDTPLYDTARQTECQPTTMQDGTVRCLPTGNPYPTANYFSDAGCTMPISVLLAAKTAATGCALPALPAFATRTTVTQTPCTVTREARPVGAIYTGALYAGTPANCVVVALGDNNAHVLGAAAAMDDFPAATVVTDP